MQAQAHKRAISYIYKGTLLCAQTHAGMCTHRHTIGNLDADRRIVITTMCCGYSWYSTDQCHLSVYVCEREFAAAAAAASAHSFHGNVGTHLGLYGNFWLAPTEGGIRRRSEG